jgi:Skp family chaperone for outer membrane proteins
MFVKSKMQVLALCLGLCSAFSGVALAQGTPPAATKIGIVNIQEAIGNTNEGKKDFDALQAKFGPKQAELKGLNDELENLKKQFEAQSPKLSDEARASQAKTIEAKQKLLQRNLEDAQAEFQQAEQEVVNRIGSKLLNVLAKYGKANGYVVVLDVSNPQTPVLWANDGTVITKELVDAYNAESGVAAPPKTSGATSPRPAPARPTPSTTPK